MSALARTLAVLLFAASAVVAAEVPATDGLQIQSMSALAFGPDGVLLIGDGKAGAVVAVTLGEQSRAAGDGLQVTDLENRIAALLGNTADEIMIHDLAVSPVSHDVYLAVSRGRAGWSTRWLLPNDVADATILLAIDGKGEIREVPLDGLPHSRAELPNPVAADRTHRWKEGVSLRSDTITDMAYADGTVYVAGLSNEEFASTMWKVAYPFGDSATATTLEIFHAAHGAFETHAPIRTFVPYELAGESHLLAAYLCTPFVSFPVAALEDGKHVKGRTLGEFGSGNYPLDMVAYRKGGKERLLIANSNLPLMIVDAAEIESFEGELLEEPETYLAGLRYEPRSGTGIQQLDRLGDDHFVALQRLPGGTLDLVSLPVRRF